ncbi:putative PIF1 DNA helicase/replication protein A1-like protein [Tanacetum coccineum]
MAGSKDGTPEKTNKRKANAIPAIIPTNIAPIVDLSIRKTGRPATRPPMTQDMRNDLINSKTGKAVTSQPMTQGAISSKQDTPYLENPTLLASDMQNFKEKRVTRQSLRRMNSTQPKRKPDKFGHRDGFDGLSKDYLDHEDPIFPCESCGALLWHAETLRRATDALDQSYSICCSRGKVKLGTELKEPPQLLKDLITNEHDKSASFIDNIRRYNSMFAFTSMGGKVDDTVNYGRGPFCYRIHGENYHRVGSLLPETGKTPKFAQLYIFDTDNEISNRIKAVSKESCTSSKDKKLDHQHATEIRDMLDSINLLVKKFRMAGDFDSTKNKRDIILLQQDGDLKRISKLHPQYLAMQYPLFFPYAEDGYHIDIFHNGVTNYDEKIKGIRVTMKEWFSYRVQERENEFSMMLNGRSLFQQFLVDGYTMIEAERMSFNRKQQKELRSETCSKLAKSAEDPESGVQLRGKKGVLSSSFTESPRPDVMTRVFKIKLDSLMKDLKERHIFGHVKGAVYTIEFQKRGLPHCHILLWLEPED